MNLPTSTRAHFAASLLAGALLGWIPSGQASDPEASTTTVDAPPSYRVSEILTPGDKPFDQIVIVEGFPVSVCKRDGKKAWIRDMDPDVKGTLRVECLGDMKRFDQTSVGRTIQVRGILREKRMDAAYFDEWEASVVAAQAGGEAPEETKEACTGDCANKTPANKTLARIHALRAQLEKSPVGYLSSIWIDGIEWHPVETTAQR